LTVSRLFPDKGNHLHYESERPTFASRQLDIKRVLSLPTRVAVILLECQGHSATAPVVGALEACVLSSTAASYWALFLLVYMVATIAGYGVELDSFGVLAATRVLLFSVLFSRSSLLIRNKLAANLVDRRWRWGPAVAVCLLATAATLTFAGFSGPLNHLFSRLTMSASLLYVSVVVYKRYVSRGGATALEIIRCIDVRNVVLTVGTVVFFLAGFEGFIRIFAPQTRFQPTGIFLPHPVRIADSAPFSERRYSSSEYSVRYTTNELGLKDYTIPPKEPTTFRVLCVGDSFTMSWGTSIDEAYPKILKRLLEERHPAASIEVVNFGLLRYAIPHHLSAMREFGFDLDPDLIVLQFYPENDIPDTLGFVGKRMRSCNVRHERDQAALRKKQTLPFRIRSFLRRHSHASVLLYDRWDVLKLQYGWFREKMGRIPSIPGRPSYLEPYLKEYYPELDEGWALTETYLREFIDECRTRQTPLIAFEVPAGFEFVGQWKEKLVDNAVPDVSIYDLSKCGKLIENIFERLDVPYVDLRQALLDTGHPEDYYWQTDVHLNLEGSAMTAALLQPHVSQYYRDWAKNMAQGEAAMGKTIE